MRSIPCTAVVALFVAACGADGGTPGEIQHVSSALAPSGNGPPAPHLPTPNDADDPGDHGTNEPWVHCRQRIQQVANDPFGPVVSHGLVEAPGYRPRLLNRTQTTALRRVSLQLGAYPLDVVASNIALPRSPTEDDVADIVGGALALAGRATSLRLRATPVAPVQVISSGMKEWSVVFEHQGTRVAGGFCRVTDLGVSTGARAYCALPETTSTSHFSAFAIDRAAAERAAAAHAQFSSYLARTTQLYVPTSNGEVSARFQVDLWDGEHGLAVALDGGGLVLGSFDDARTFTFGGWDVDFAKTGDYPTTIVTPIDVGANQLVFLDTAERSPRPEAQNCNVVGAYTEGFVVCGNGLGEPVLVGGRNLATTPPRADGDFNNLADAIDPRAPQQLISSSVVGTPWFRPPLPADAAFAHYFVSGTTSPTPTDEQKLVATAHHAELQAFHAMGRLQKWYEAVGHTVNANGQDSRRLEIRVHAGTDISVTPPVVTPEATVTRPFAIDIGDFWNPATATLPFEGTTEATIVAHEYQHHVQFGLEERNHWIIGTGCGTVGCTRDALYEGLGDAFSTNFTGHDRTGLFYDPASTFVACADTSAFPNNPLTGLARLQRFACNSLAYDYWLTSPDTTPEFPDRQYEIHRRGSVVFGALYSFQRRLIDGGLVTTVPGAYMYGAEQNLPKPTDDERVVLANLIAYLKTQPFQQKRYWHTALISFEEKNVFLRPGAGRPDVITCNAASCTVDQARQVSLRTIATDAPLQWSPTQNNPPPQLRVFAPLGDQYESRTTDLGSIPTVTVEFATDASFSTPLGEAIDLDRAPPNHSPPGFTRFVPDAGFWDLVVSVANAVGSNRIYYRVRQCLSATGECVYSSSSAGPTEEAPFLTLGTPGGGVGGGCGGGSCRTSNAGGDARAPLLVVMILSGTWLARRRSRRIK